MAFGFTFNSRSSVCSSFFFQMYQSNLCRDCFLDRLQSNIWGNRIIKLMDTTFWQQLTSDPGKYKEGFKKKNNLMACDFAVIPIIQA
jgi:hypothetical protein